MKKTVIILTINLFSACVLNGITYTNKTFMSVPNSHNNIPMQYSSWHRILKQGSSDANAWGGILQAVPFYSNSNNSAALGKYFGANYKNELVVGAAGASTDIQNNLLIHRQQGDDDASIKTNLAGTLKLNPKHTESGVYFNYNHNLDNVKKGLFFKLGLPFTHVSNDIGASVANEIKDTHTNKGVLDFFNGNLSQSYNASYDYTIGNSQDALTHAKITGPNSKTGIADVTAIIGYKFTEHDDLEFTGNIKLLFPTGGNPTGERLFEAINGNRDHWGIGASTNASLSIFKEEDHCLECLFLLDFMYLFKSDEKRTLGYRNGIDYASGEDTTVRMAWNHYYQGAQDGLQKMFPLANVLTQDVSVQPGSELQGHCSLAYHRKNVTFDFGYSFFSKEGEKVSIKSWTNNKYAPVSLDYNTGVAFSLSDETHFLGGAIQKSELDTTTASTPAVLKQAIHAAISYTLSERKNPFMFGCGFCIDWTHDNSTPTGYTLWGKVGAAF